MFAISQKIIMFYHFVWMSLTVEEFRNTNPVGRKMKANEKCDHVCICVNNTHGLISGFLFLSSLTLEHGKKGHQQQQNMRFLRYCCNGTRFFFLFYSPPKQNQNTRNHDIFFDRINSDFVLRIGLTVIWFILHSPHMKFRLTLTVTRFFVSKTTFAIRSPTIQFDDVIFTLKVLEGKPFKQSIMILCWNRIRFGSVWILCTVRYGRNQLFVLFI